MRLVTAIRLVLPLFVFASSPAGAQDAREITVTGTVQDNTGLFLPGASVFVSGTSWGAVTNDRGEFALRVLAGSPFQLTVSMIGYETESRQVSPDNSPGGAISFTLSPSTIPLSEVKVSGEIPRDWLRNLQRFRRLLFSTTPNASDSRIVNPEVLTLTVDPSSQVLYATAETPLYVENVALGYRLEIFNFSFAGTETAMTWAGEHRFQEIEPSTERLRQRRLERRKDAYLGSARHFWAWLQDQAAPSAGPDYDLVSDKYFTVYEVDAPGVLVDASRSSSTKLLSRGKLRQILQIREAEPALLQFTGVLYVTFNGSGEEMDYVRYQEEMGIRARSLRRTRLNYQSSWVALKKSHALLDGSGTEVSHGALLYFGYWAWERMAELLPTDFSPRL